MSEDCCRGSGPAGRIPAWAKKSLTLKDLHAVKSVLRKGRLASVCEEARCPNITECFSKPCATFLILGNLCTRSCRFCSISKGMPAPPDEDEGITVARTALSLGLKHVVITSVSRDDLPDKGAGAFARVIWEVRKYLPDATIEVLVPDFSGRHDLIEMVLSAMPDVFNHNVETVDRLYGTIRPQASLKTSLEVIRTAREYSRDLIIKSGFMVGLGEEEKEIALLLNDLKHSGCDVVTIGQYLQPMKSNAQVMRYRHPSDFERFSDLAKNLGIRYVISGPLVRSSYRAKEILEEILHDRKENDSFDGGLVKDTQ